MTIACCVRAHAGRSAVRENWNLWGDRDIKGSTGGSAFLGRTVYQRNKRFGSRLFSGCALHCVFCQNESIAQGTAGKEITPERLVEIFLELQEQGANNINLVTPGQYVPHIIRAVEQARRQGLAVPIVYNTGSYENVDTIKALEGIVDIYLPDFKYMDPFLAAKYSHASDYPQTAKAAIAEMVRQQPRPVFAWEEKEAKTCPRKPAREL